ncbi:hypothetical protein Dimus_034667, partial [Dionaea muscipula]
QLREVENWAGEVAPAQLISPRQQRCSSSPKLETILEEDSGLQPASLMPLSKRTTPASVSLIPVRL